MKHSFLLEEGKWFARGIFTDENQVEIPVTGETEIKHQPGFWTIEGFMVLELEGSEQVKLENNYRINPFAQKAGCTSWESFNPALGQIIGKFLLMDEILVSSYMSRDGEYTGTEVMLLVDQNHYKSKGYLYKGEKRISSWEVCLERERE